MKMNFCILRNLLSMILCLLMIFCVAAPLCSATGGEDDEEEDYGIQEGYFHYIVADEKATITYVEYASADALTVPNTLGGYEVATIARYAFCECMSTAITLPDTVTYIGGGAFASPKLQSINIPNGVTYIGVCAFSGSAIKSIAIPSSVDYISECAFSDCDDLESVVLPDGIDTVYYGTFMNCTSLKEVTLPKSLKRIQDLAFARCSALENLVLPNGVTQIDDCAFLQSGIKKIVIPETVSFIQNEVFCYSENTTDAVLYVAPGSYAETYAVERNISCADIVDYFAFGDINYDEKVDSSDMLALQHHILGISPLPSCNARSAILCKNESVSSADLLLLQQHILGITA